MRFIKFRAWDNHQKIMCYEVDVYSPGGDVQWWTGQHRYPEGNKADFFDNTWKGNALMQFTGLYGKNGKEIWEGDILSYQALRLSGGGVRWYAKSSQHDKRVEARCVVVYKAPRFNLDHSNAFTDALKKPIGKELDERVIQHRCFDYEDDGNYYEVLGNIYENGDLLK